LRRPPQEQPKDPDLARAHLHQAIQAYRQGRFPQAAQAAEQALLHDPSDPVAWYYLGAAHWMLGQRDRAADDFRQGSTREQSSRLSYRELNNLLSPIQGPVRNALDAARP
jgi:Flp pilus assembly protein TadD